MGTESYLATNNFGIAACISCMAQKMIEKLFYVVVILGILWWLLLRDE